MNTSPICLIAAVVVLVFAHTLPAIPIVTTPPGLSQGDKYHLAFVTDSATWFVADETNTDADTITSYNAMVMADAAAAGLDIIHGAPVDWFAIVSVSSIDARDNIQDPMHPIYDLDGNAIALEEADLWDGSLLSPIGVTPTGSTDPGNFGLLVWTDTIGDGTSANPLGLPFAFANVGVAGQMDPSWINLTTDDRTHVHRLYAISSELTVPVPEPTSFAILGFGACLVLGVRRRITRTA